MITTRRGLPVFPLPTVAVGRTNEGDDPWVLWSHDGIDGQADLLPTVDEGEDVRLVGVAHDGNEFVIAGESHRRGEPDTAAIRSSRDGVVWERQEPQPSVFGDGEVRLAAVWGSNGTVLMSGTGVHRASPLYYYDDPDTCRQPFPAL